MRHARYICNNNIKMQCNCKKVGRTKTIAKIYAAGMNGFVRYKK